MQYSLRLTVRLLVAGTSARAAELLGLAASGVSDKEGSIICYEEVLDGLLGSLINELLGVSDDALGDGLTDSVHLRGGSTALDADANVNIL